ncbi:alpha/beta hydrolase fold domain-containing protein [Bacillus massiliigorillae]|uniref:alpha/beta hydrolase fold domain-containing protein n=1 Tax=Bacillus massiliigorillae TaxID=1243664 RepID=UPI00039B288D|nr:alpha/beta hydrolase [Bacillus massiliigorillae]
MESYQSKGFKLLLRLVGRKRFWMKSGEALRKGIAKRRLLNHEPPNHFYKKLNIEKKCMNDYNYYEIRPTHVSSSMHLFYLHGGGYVHKITSFHWKFLRRLVDALQCTITIPLYPLAPEHTYKHTFEFVYPLYINQVQKMANDKDIVIMGDSAGGGLALALAHYLKEMNVPQPGHIILISPWLDISLNNPEIADIEPYDFFLTKSGLIEVGRLYAGGDDPLSHLLSPMYGELQGLSDITLFMGSHDILVADSRKLMVMAEEQGVLIDYHEYPNMMHDFPLFMFPESKMAMDVIVNKLRE